MTVSEGMDTSRARGVADQLRTQADALVAMGAQGTAMMQVLEEAWSGPDTEGFTADWESARPQIDRAGQSVSQLGQELVRQADEQDAASEASASGGEGAAGSDAPVSALPRLPIAKLPHGPDIFKKIQDMLSKIIERVGSVFTIPAWITDLFGWLDDAFAVLNRWPKLGLLIKGLGKLTPFVSAVIAFLTIGDAYLDLFTEGPSWDVVMQFLEGLTGGVSAVLGVAALFASGTVVGIPIGLALGALSVLMGAYSIVLGWSWDAYKEDPGMYDRYPLKGMLIGLPPGLVGQPGSDSPITPPSFPRPNFPWSSSLPKPGLPGIPLPKLG